jgi:hypothetical protein
MVRSVRYQVQVRVEGELPPTWSVLFAGLEMTLDPDGTTVVGGELADQVAVHGLVDAIRDLGLSLVSIDAVASPRPTTLHGG